MSDVTISREDAGTKIRYVGHVASKPGEGELTMVPLGNKVYSADHTGVPESLSGNGLGTRLVEFMIADARKNGLKVVPDCPFIAAKWKEHEEWSDVLTWQH